MKPSDHPELEVNPQREQAPRPRSVVIYRARRAASLTLVAIAALMLGLVVVGPAIADHFRIGSPLVYQGFQPCRMVDTRNAVSAFGGPKLAAGATRNFNLVPSAGACPSAVPPGVKSIVVNVTLTQTETAFGYLTIYPGGTAAPNSSSINWDTSNATLANEVIMPVGADGSINIFASEGTHVILDIVGYFLDELATGDRLAITGSFSAGSPIVGFNNSAAAGSHGIGGFAGAAGSVYGVQGQAGAATIGSSSGVRGLSRDCCTGDPGFGSGVLGIGGTSTTGVVGTSDNQGVVGINTSGLTSTVASFGALGRSDTVAIFGSGNSQVTGTKSFVEPHPTDPDKVIRFVSLEGPEAGTYFRGRGKFKGKRAVIEVPESFRMVTEEENLSIQVTPIGKMAQVAVVKISLDKIVVQASENVEFFYTVNGERRGFKDFEVVGKADREFTPISPDATMPSSLSDVQKQRLIATGVYHPNGTVNLATARHFGWDKEWAEREAKEQIARRSDEERKAIASR